MARYRGKREEPRSERGWEDKSAGIGDPFQEEPINLKAPKSKPDLKARWGAYWESGKGKILVTVLSCLAVFVLVVVAAARMWIKPPSIPVEPIQDDVPQQTVPNQTDLSGDAEPTEPTDDELYPDDGYNGDMPTVSGNRKEGVYTFLLVGTDMWDGNTDTIMVASYDTKGQGVSIMSIPRDTMINESWDIKKINSVYSRTGGSISSLANRVQKLVGFKPDFYVKVDLSMFVKLVDLVGGVEFDVPQDMKYDDPYQDLHIDLKKGVQVLDGEHAMQLVRFRRYSEGDIKRVEVQQAFMKALIKECLSLQHWGKIKAYIDLAMENVQTDLEAGSVVWFAANVLGLNGVPALDMENVYTCTIPGNYWGEAWSRSTRQNQSYVTIYPKQVVELVNERFNPYEQQVTTGMLDAMSIQSNGNIVSSTGSVKDSQHNAIMAVRRGEAYYDGSGNIVYGQPPVKPKQDENGNYYIEDENGAIVYTDESGEPLADGPVLPPSDGVGQPVTLPQTPTDGNTSGGQTGPDNQGGGNSQDNPGSQDSPDNQDSPGSQDGLGNQVDPGSQTEPGLPSGPEDSEPPDTPDTPPEEPGLPEDEPPVESTEMPDWLRPQE